MSRLSADNAMNESALVGLRSDFSIIYTSTFLRFRRGNGNTRQTKPYQVLWWPCMTRGVVFSRLDEHVKAQTEQARERTEALLVSSKRVLLLQRL